MKTKRFVSLALAALLACASSSPACTGITIKPQDGTVIRARTLEFGDKLNSDLLIIPRGFQFTAADGGDKVGMKWSGKYGFVGANVLGHPIFADGLNEKGLSVGLFYFPTFASFAKATPEQANKLLAPWDLGTYFLSTCASVDEAVEALKRVVVADVTFKDWGIVPPVHYVVADASGREAVIEFVDGKARVYDNALGVITNSPTFDWHLTNLRNYLSLSAFNALPEKLPGLTLSPLGQGGGMHGLPGDFTPPSRFVRAVAFTQTALPSATAYDGLLQAFHILNQFDIPKGAVREKDKGQVFSEYTEWTSAADMTHRRYYIRTFINSRIREVDLDRCNLTAKAPVTLKLDSKETFEEITPGVVAK
ncbi:MAG: linear amide C-N hydrolase [Chthoniobacteraceae bacterium]